MRRSLRLAARLGSAPCWYLAICGLACAALVVETFAEPTPAGQYRSYRLQHKSAAAVQEMLSQLLAGGKSGSHFVVDSQTNQVLVQGPEEVQQIVQKLIQQVDRPPQPLATSQPVLHAYLCDRSRLETEAGRLRAEYAANPHVTVATDPTMGQLLVLAPPEVHAQIDRSPALARQDREQGDEPAQPAPGAQPLPRAIHQETATSVRTGRASPRLVRRPGPTTVQLTHSRAEQIEARVKELFGMRLQAKVTTLPGQSEYTLTGADQKQMQLVFDRPRNRMTLAGADTLADQVERLIRALDSEPPRVGRTLRVLPLRNADPAKVEEAARAYRGRFDDPEKSRPLPAATDGPSAPLPAGDVGGEPTPAGSTRAGQVRIPLVSYVFQDPDEEQEQETPSDEQPAEAGAPRRGALGPDVEIETLPELDVIILRGSNQDVDELIRIIEELERISAENEPVVEVLPLKHVLGEALARLIAQVQIDLFANRQGRVNVIPLVKPDSLLLIGWGDALDVAKELIQKLDQPVAADSLLKVFPLRNAPVGTVLTTINSIFASRTGGLGARVTIASDIRTNVLIVQAAPRDMAEVEMLIQRLDVAGSETVKQVEVFELRNSLATDLVATLQAAAQPGAVGTGSAILELLTEDAEGKRILQSGVLSDMSVTPNPQKNSLIITAPARSMPLVRALIAKLDEVPGTVKQLHVFTLRNSLATDLAATLTAAIQAAATGQPGAAAKNPAILELLTVDPLNPLGERILKSGMLGDIGITADTQKNTLVVTAPAESIPLIKALIDQLDESPGAVAQIKVFRVTNGDANTLVEMLRALLPEKTGAAVSPQLAGAEGETSLAPLRLSVDSRTNSIIATGSAGDLSIVHALLERLDEDTVRLRKNFVYRLLNAPALEVSNAINMILRSERQLEQAPPGIVSPFQQIEREVVVVPEIVSNAIIISATPQFFEDIVLLIKDLDKPPPQVMIQVVIAEVVLNNTDEFGVELGLQDSLLFDRSLLGELVTTTSTFTQQTPDGLQTLTQDVVQGAENMPGFAFNNMPLGNSGSDKAFSRSDKVAGQALSAFNLGRMNTELGYGGLVLAAGSESVSVLIRALQESRRLEVLARPQVMTLDNQPAYIQVGQRVPRIVGTQLSEVGQVNSVSLENVGLILGVTPRINPNGAVVMEIDTEQSKVGPEQEGIPISISATGEIIRSPRIDTRTAQTTVSAVSGQTIVLGGLISKSSEKTHRRVPFLADVPVLGHLFRYDFERNLRTELLIILTPHVIRTPEDAQRLRHIEECRMSWTACDVQQIHGMDGICNNDNCPYCRGKTRVIYPDLDPSGTTPEQLPLEPTEVLPAPETGPAAPVPAGPVQPTSYDQPETRTQPGPGGAPAEMATDGGSRLPPHRPGVTRLPPAQPDPTNRDDSR